LQAQRNDLKSRAAHLMPVHKVEPAAARLVAESVAEALALRRASPGIGGYFLAIALVVFAYTTILSSAYYGEKCREFLVGSAVGG
jgi:Na+/alanine symporter